MPYVPVETRVIKIVSDNSRCSKRDALKVQEIMRRFIFTIGVIDDLLNVKTNDVKFKFIWLEANPEVKKDVENLVKDGVQDILRYYIPKDYPATRIMYWIDKDDIVESSEGYEVNHDLLVANALGLVQELHGMIDTFTIDELQTIVDKVLGVVDNFYSIHGEMNQEILEVEQVEPISFTFFEKKKLGRNEKCHCGSGKKYKNCHWKADFYKHLRD